MEKYTMFMDWKNQYSENQHSENEYSEINIVKMRSKQSIESMQALERYQWYFVQT